MKMKKTLALLLAVGMCFGFAACEDDVASSSSSPSSSSSGGGEHEHTYSTEWSKDETHHWYACTGEECTEVDKKAEHDWDGGEITTAATPTADGVKTFTCETCGKTKTEAVQYVADTEVTAEEWLAAMSFANEDNFTVSSVATGLEQYTEYDGTTIHMYGVSPMGENIEQYCAKVGEDYVLYSVSNGTVRKTTVPKSAYDNMKSSGLDTTFLFASFQYDAASKTYKADEISYGNGMLRYTNVEVAFENGRLVRMTYNYFYQGGAPFVTTTTVTYDNVQTLAVPTTELADEAAWLAALNKATSIDVAKTVRVYTGESAVEANLTYVYKITDTVTYEYNSADSGMERIVVMDGTTNAMYQRSGVNATSVLGGWMYSSNAEYVEMYSQYFNIYKTAQADYMGAGTFANFTYDDATGAYSYTIPGPYSSNTQCKAYCVNGELRALYWYGARGMKGYQYYYVFDYTEPQMDIPVLTVTETEYANAYADLKDATVAKSISVDSGNGRTLYMTDGVSIFVGESDYELIYTKNGTNYYCYTRYYDDGEGSWGAWRVQTVTQLEYEQGYAMYYMSAMSFVQEPAYSALTPEVYGCYTWSDADYEYTYYFENGRFQAMYAEGISGSDRQLAVNYGVPEIEIPQNATPID